jgi:hypothetical protein
VRDILQNGCEGGDFNARLLFQMTSRPCKELLRVLGNDADAESGRPLSDRIPSRALPEVAQLEMSSQSHVPARWITDVSHQGQRSRERPSELALVI